MKANNQGKGNYEHFEHQHNKTKMENGPEKDWYDYDRQRKNVLRCTGRQGKLPPIHTGTLEMKANNQGKGNY